MPGEKCPKCQQPLLPRATFCHHCGTRLDGQAAPPQLQASTPTPGPPKPALPTLDAKGRLVCAKCKTANRGVALHCRTCGSGLTPRSIARPGELVTPTGESIGILAGFWVRFAAYVLDSLILSLAVGVFVAPFLGEGGTALDDLSPTEYIGYALGFLYAVVGWSTFGTTLGKRLFKLYVVRPDGSIPSAARALLRQLATLLSILTLCFGYIMIGIRPDKRGLHDLLSDTYVVIKL